MPSVPLWASFQDLYQLGYVTTDADHAMGLFRERHGIPAFKDLGPITLPLDDGATARIRICMCFVGPIQVEIIEPMGGADDVYRAALPSSGFGLTWHHFARRIDSLDALDAIKTDLISKGERIAISGGDPKVAKFFYVDARATLSHYVEYLYVSPARLALHAALPRY